MSLGTNRAAISRYINGFDEESKALIKEISTLSVWSESSIDIIWMMPYTERAILSDVIKEKVEILYGKKGIAVSRPMR